MRYALGRRARNRPLTGWHSPELKEILRTMPSVVAAYVLVIFMKKSLTIGASRSLGGLPALALAGALCLLMLGPALADFESAVAD
jgi:hypothetical protein